MSGLGQIWEQLIQAVCRPPRDEYRIQDLLGGVGGVFSFGHTKARREDFQLTNTRGKRLEVSRFLNARTHTTTEPLPTVIYCHCNSGSRRDAEEAVFRLLPDGISVVCLDFEGSGMSEGDYVTLGAHEVDDVQCVIQHLRENGKASVIGLWGRSMGAVTALLCSQRDPSIAGIVCDSPFSRLRDLMLELAEEMKIPVPKYLVKVALAFLRRSIRSRAGFDIIEVAPIAKVEEAFVPALFGHAEDDTFIPKRHSELLYEKYSGEKNFVTFEGDHNSHRPLFFHTSVVIFFHNVLQLERSGAGPASASGLTSGLDRELFSFHSGGRQQVLGATGNALALDGPGRAHPSSIYKRSGWWMASTRADDEPSFDGGGGLSEMADEDEEEVLMRVLRLSLEDQDEGGRAACDTSNQPRAELTEEEMFTRAIAESIASANAAVAMYGQAGVPVPDAAQTQAPAGSNIRPPNGYPAEACVSPGLEKFDARETGRPTGSEHDESPVHGRHPISPSRRNFARDGDPDHHL